MKKILLVDDEMVILEDRSHVIRDLGFECIIAKDGEEAVRLIQDEKPDVVLTDQKLPKKDGFDILKAVMEIEPDLPVVLFTGYGTVESAVAAMKMGAFDYIQKPFSPDVLEVILKRAVEYRQLRKENVDLRSQLNDPHQLRHVIGQSDAIKQVAKRVLKVAKSNANVIIYGESGTGKEMIARSLHYYSNRKDKPFIPLDCVSLPITLLESELFGFERGAFTGAVKSKPGLFELAEEGTLFLDEISELDYQLQAKLLRVLQERQFRRVGGKELIQVNVRLISATNWHPDKAVKAKKLREDLYYRLHVVPIYIPPLRDRKDDIPILTHHFIEKYNPFSAIEVKGITSDTLQCLTNYSWPGNVRELENCIQQAISLTDHDFLQLMDLPEKVRNSREEVVDESIFNLSYKEAKNKYLEYFNRQYLSKLLKEYNGNISKVARVANISRITLYRMMESYHIKH